MMGMPGMGMGMGMGTPMGGPMNMQMTGGSGFDPRFSMGPGQFDNFAGNGDGRGYLNVLSLLALRAVPPALDQKVMATRLEERTTPAQRFKLEI